MSLTQENVKKIARLSRLKIEDNECEKIATQLSSIVNWIDQLTAVDTSGLEDCPDGDEPLMTEREDVVTQDNTVEDVLANAPSSGHNMFSVPKVVE